MDCSPLGFSVPGIFQARTLEWIAIPFPGDLPDPGIEPLGWEDPLAEGMAAHSSILARRIPWTEEPGGLQSIGSQRVRHD